MLPHEIKSYGATGDDVESILNDTSAFSCGDAICRTRAPLADRKTVIFPAKTKLKN
jgi:hypothetical protein